MQIQTNHVYINKTNNQSTHADGSSNLLMSILQEVTDCLLLPFRPVNFIDEVYRRWAYAACFVLLTNDIMQMFLGDSKLSLLPKDDKEWMKKFGFVRGRVGH